MLSPSDIQLRTHHTRQRKQRGCDGTKDIIMRIFQNVEFVVGVKQETKSPPLTLSFSRSRLDLTEAGRSSRGWLRMTLLRKRWRQHMMNWWRRLQLQHLSKPPRHSICGVITFCCTDHNSSFQVFWRTVFFVNQVSVVLRCVPYVLG